MRFIPIFLLLAGVMASVSCTRERSSAVTIDKAFRTVIWPDTKVLAGVDLKRLKTTALYREHEADLLPLLQNSERFGLDARRDLSYLGFVSNGEQQLFYASGDFDPKRIEGNLLAHGAQRTQSGRFTLLGNSENAVVFLADKAAISGSRAAVKSALAIEEKGSGEVPEELEQRLRALPADDQFWLVSRGGIPLAAAPLRPDMKTNLSNFTAYIDTATVGLQANAGMVLQARLGCRNADGATRVHDALRGVLGLARLSTKDSETDLLQVYDAIHVEKAANLVRVDATLTRQQTDRLSQLIAKNRPR